MAEAGPKKREAKGAGCVQVWPEARFRGYGYVHVVHVENGCAKRARCWVHTDVNPAEAEVEVAAGAAEVVVTFRGSPARVFVPRARCALEGRVVRLGEDG